MKRDTTQDYFLDFKYDVQLYFSKVIYTALSLQI